MAAKKRNTSSARRPAPGAARAKQSPPIGRALVRDALESWVVPTVALSAAALFWAMSAIDVWPEPVAVVGVATSLLILALFAALRPYLFTDNARHRQVAFAFAAIWGLLLFVSFYRHNFPGTPLAGGVLRPGGEAIAVPPGLDALVTDGHFVAQQSQGNRLGHYHM